MKVTSRKYSADDESFFIIALARVGVVLPRYNDMHQPGGYRLPDEDPDSILSIELGRRARAYRELRAEVYGEQFGRTLKDEHPLTFFAYARWCEKKLAEQQS